MFNKKVYVSGTAKKGGYKNDTYFTGEWNFDSVLPPTASETTPYSNVPYVIIVPPELDSFSVYTKLSLPETYNKTDFTITNTTLSIGASVWVMDKDAEAQTPSALYAFNVTNYTYYWIAMSDVTT